MLLNREAVKLLQFLTAFGPIVLLDIHKVKQVETSHWGSVREICLHPKRYRLVPAYLR